MFKTASMKKTRYLLIISVILFTYSCKPPSISDIYEFKSFVPPVDYLGAGIRADSILEKLSLDEEIELIGGHDMFYTQGYKQFGIPSFYFSDATQGVHLRKDLKNQLDSSTAFPCPLALAATWNVDLAGEYAQSIGEECRAGGIAVLLGPGMNIYRISQNGRNFEYFGEDPFLASRMIENYVVGVQSTGTIATLKHFICNNTDYHRRRSNSIVDERTLHEIYLPAFKAGVDAGAMAVMTSYNQVNGEWAGQSNYVIGKLLRDDLKFKWLVMSDWWSVWDPAKAVKAGLDLDMPGHPGKDVFNSDEFKSMYIRANAKKLLNEGKITGTDIRKMTKDILTTFISMGLMDRPVKDTNYLRNFGQHEKAALQTARESIVLLRNENNILPIAKEGNKKILLTGKFAEKLAKGEGSAYVEGYHTITLHAALLQEFGNQLTCVAKPSADQFKQADVILLSIGTDDSEGWDRPFNLRPATDSMIVRIASLNPNLVIIVNSGGGIQMTRWNDKVAAILYAWYPGQTGNNALAEIIAGKVNPSGKLPVTIEKKFEDSPGYPYIPEGDTFYTDWKQDVDMTIPINNIDYDEGVFVGYRWYDSKNIKPLYPFGFGLSYTSFEYSSLKIQDRGIDEAGDIIVQFMVKNTGEVSGYETAQLYVGDMESSVSRPVKELKGFRKVYLNPEENIEIIMLLHKQDFSFWNDQIHSWQMEPGAFKIMIGASSDDIRLTQEIKYKADE